MSIINDENLKQNHHEPSSLTIQFLAERMFAVTSFIDKLGFEGESKKVYVTPESPDKAEECTYCSCLAVLTLLPEAIIELLSLLVCFIPSLMVDCCQSAIGNTTSQNMLILEKKMLKVNDEVIISNDFNVDEIFDVQYRRGTLGQFLLNRTHYHHQPSGNLIDRQSRKSNETLYRFQRSGTKGRIVSIVDGGNISVELTESKDNDVPNTKVYRLSPLIVDRVTYSDDELEIYTANKQHIRKGEWIQTFEEIDPTSKISFESPLHPNYQTPTDKLIPCFACAGLILSAFCNIPSCFGCHLIGDILMCNNECTCCKVSKIQDTLCICCNANVSCIVPRSLCKCLYQCFFLDFRFKIPPWINETDTTSLRDFPCLCTFCGLTCCYQRHCYGPKLWRSVGSIRKDFV